MPFLFSKKENTSSIDYEFRTTVVKELHSDENMIKIGKEIEGAAAYFLQDFSYVRDYFHVKTNKELFQLNDLKYIPHKYNLLISDLCRPLPSKGYAPVERWSKISGKRIGVSIEYHLSICNILSLYGVKDMSAH